MGVTALLSDQPADIQPQAQAAACSGLSEAACLPTEKACGMDVAQSGNA